MQYQVRNNWRTRQSAANRSPPSNFPVIREKTGNFEIIASLEQKMGANFEANSECYRQIPCATEQGIAFARTGNFEQQNRECIRAIRESAACGRQRWGPPRWSCARQAPRVDRPSLASRPG